MSNNQTSTANEPVSFFWSEGETKDDITQGGDAAEKTAAGSRPADLRLHFGSFFVRIIAGKERRSPQRLKKERKENPAFTLRNLPLILAVWLLSGGALIFLLGRTLQIIAQM